MSDLAMSKSLQSGVFSALQHLKNAAALPPWARYFILIVAILNFGSLPGVWTIRTVIPWFVFGIKRRLGQKMVNERVGQDVFDHRETIDCLATLDKCDAFGMHLSNSSYSVASDYLRGPGTVGLVGPYFDLPSAGFAVGGTSYKFTKEIGILQRFSVTNQLVGYNHKWLFTMQTFTSRNPRKPHDAPTVHAVALTHIVLKIKRRTVPPARALALAGYGVEHGAKNWAIAQTMTSEQKLKWLFLGEGDEDTTGLMVGPKERGLESRSDWPGAL